MDVKSKKYTRIVLCLLHNWEKKIEEKWKQRQNRFSYFVVIQKRISVDRNLLFSSNIYKIIVNNHRLLISFNDLLLYSNLHIHYGGLLNDEVLFN